MLAGVDVGKRGDAQGTGVGSHVQAVGQQRHGSVHQAGDDLDHHHGCRERDHPEGPALAGFHNVLPKGVTMGMVLRVGLFAVSFHRRIKSFAALPDQVSLAGTIDKSDQL